MDKNQATSTNSLDASTNQINLFTAVTNSLKPGDTIASSAIQVVRWLAREGVDETSFHACATPARGPVYPNDFEVSIRQKLEGADRGLAKLPKVPLPLVAASTGDGWFIRSNCYQRQRVCYVASTAAVLSSFRDSKWISDVIPAMILDTGGHENGIEF